MQQEKVRTKQKRLQTQQGIIAVVCLALIVFVFSWLINTVVTGRKNGLMPASAKTQSSSAADDSSQPDLSDSSESQADSSAADTSSAAEESSSKPYDDAAINDDFSDACFVGDSRTVGLEMNCDKPEADFYASQGLDISHALTDQIILLDNGNYGTVVEGVAQKQYRRIFIMFGINELGWPYPDNFVSKYVELINEIKEVEPNASIYVQSVLPVTSKAVETNEVFTNENIDAFNSQYVKQVADETDVNYLDINPYFKDENGSLPEDAASDGIHFYKGYCLEWIDLLAYLVPATVNG